MLLKQEGGGIGYKPDTVPFSRAQGRCSRLECVKMERNVRVRGSSAVLSILALVALLGCKALARKASGGSRAPSGPITLNWEQPYKLTIQGTKAEGTFFPTKDADKPPLKLMASFHDFPQGTKVKIGSEQSTIGEGGYWSTLVDIKPAVLKQPLDDLKGPIALDVDLSIEFPGSPAAATKLQNQEVKDGVRFALLRARDGAVNFGTGDEPARKPRSAAVLSGYSDLEFIGKGKTLYDVDWVVIAEDQKEPSATKSCAFKEGKATLKLFDASAIVIERRTGKKLAEHMLKPSGECPMFAFIDKNDNSTKKSVDQKDVVAWARAELAKAN